MPPFDPDEEIGINLAPKWKIWLENFQMYLVALPIKRKLYHIISSRTAYAWDFTSNSRNWKRWWFWYSSRKIKCIFRASKTSLVWCLSISTSQTEQHGDTWPIPYYRLRSLFQHCDFADSDFEIMLQIVLHGTSSRLNKTGIVWPKECVWSTAIPTSNLSLKIFWGHLDNKRFPVPSNY
jgi:hypothetical protein